MTHSANPDHFKLIQCVTTVAEAARLTNRHRHTIQYAIDAGNLAAIKVGGIWLVSVDSLREYSPNLDSAE